MPENTRPHLFLLNPRGEKRSFDGSRGYTSPSINQKPASTYQVQKVILGDAFDTLKKDRLQRIERRTLQIPAHLEFIQIDFLVVFNNNDAFKNKTRFRNDFGLIPVSYSNFNQTVLFAVADEEKFLRFTEVLSLFINSSSEVHPSGTSYAIVTIIRSFRFVSSGEILATFEGGDVIMSLITPTEEIGLNFISILQALNTYLEERKAEQQILDYKSDDNLIIEVKGTSQVILQEISDNFDIVYKIQSIRVPTIKPNEYNQPDLTWAIQINPPNTKDVKVGILDNGVKPISPLKNIILDYGFDITASPPNALSPNSTHGTVVASLAALGLDYFDTSRSTFTSNAWIVPMKILNFSKGYFNPPDIEELIKQAYKQGVKIFNLSVCGPTKNYNTGISEYAFLLDRLAFQYDILIFIATGNLDEGDIYAMQQEVHANNFHDYPNHFYNPNKSSASHTCECSNVCIPAESMNNITVGAIADNCNEGTQSHLTPFKELPAFYTRKHHLDYLQKVNGTYFSESQKNTHINKPDIVMAGGDVLDSFSGMQVLGFGLAGNDFYYNDAGTSLAAPLATNLCARLLNLYPQLSMQSLKAIILNSSTPLLKDEFLDDVVEEIKNEEANKRYGKDFANLDSNQKTHLNKNISSKDLYKRLIGFGTPDINKALYSSSKRVTLVVQDSIFVDSFKVININIPSYLLSYSKSSYVLNLKATLCYKFLPVFNNHLGYNPLHISFNFMKSVVKDNPSRVAEIISNRNDNFFNEFYDENSTDKEKLKARKKALGIKTEIQSWSEDFYPRSNKPFCNAQSLELKINKEEIAKVGNQISLVIRCTSKTEYERQMVDWLKSSAHDFSVAITVSEKEDEELNGFDLYSELEQCNDLDQIVRLDVEGEQDDELILEADV